MRRKAQALIVEPTNTKNGGDGILADFVEALGIPMGESGPKMDGTGPNPSCPLKDQGAPESEMIEIAVDEMARGEEQEGAAFNKLQCGLDCLEKGLELFKDYEAKESNEEQEAEGQGGEKEKKAIEKIDDLVQKMKDVFEDLTSAEEQEHEEEGEIDTEAQAKDEGSSGSEGSEGSKPTKETEESESSEGSEGSKESSIEAELRGFTRMGTSGVKAKKSEAVIDPSFHIK